MTRAAQTEQTAALWLVRREQPDWSNTDQAGLDAWLDESMAHKAAYWRLDHGWREADRITALGREKLDDGRSAARGFRWRSFAAAAGVVALMLISAIALIPIQPKPATTTTLRFTTAVGARKLVRLVDGSRVQLNTASTVRATVNDQRREVWLDRGEAFFEIAHLSGRPFVVHAGSRTVTVLGTKFAVRRDGDKVTVSVIEGRVRIDDAQRPDSVPAAIITAGNVAVARGPSTLLAAKSEDRVEAELAWRDGMLNFDNTPLSDAIMEFNRYNRQQIEIGDAHTGDIRIGGTFQASNVDAFVRLLRDAYGLKVETNANAVKISE